MSQISIAKPLAIRPNQQDIKISRLCEDYEAAIHHIKVCQLFHLQCKLLGKDFRELFSDLAMSEDEEKKKIANQVWISCQLWRQQGEKLMQLLNGGVKLNSFASWNIWALEDLATFCIICRGIEIAYHWVFFEYHKFDYKFNHLYTDLNDFSGGAIKQKMWCMKVEDEIESARWKDNLFGRYHLIWEKLEKNGISLDSSFLS